MITLNRQNSESLEKTHELWKEYKKRKKQG